MPPLLDRSRPGAARGIGLAIASRLAADGMRVALLDLDPAVTEAAARTVGGEALALSANVTKGADVDAAVGRVVAHLIQTVFTFTNSRMPYSDSSRP